MTSPSPRPQSEFSRPSHQIGAAGRTAAVLLALAAGLAPAHAESAAAPAPLHGKSFVVSWSENRVQRNEGEPAFRPVRANQTLQLYVSTSGRVFSRLTFATGRGTGTASRVQGDITKNPMFRQWDPAFGDKTLALAQNFQKGGKRLVEIEHDGALTSCKAKVTYVPEEGAMTSFGWSPIIKKMVEFQSIEMSGDSCAIRSGIVFQDG